MVLGKDVFDARGDRLGAVVDVGVHDHRRVKFLVLEPDAPGGSLTRLNVDLIGEVASGRLVLKP